jgi:hypothetical protein
MLFPERLDPQYPSSEELAVALQRSHQPVRRPGRVQHRREERIPVGTAQNHAFMLVQNRRAPSQARSPKASPVIAIAARHATSRCGRNGSF